MKRTQPPAKKRLRARPGNEPARRGEPRREVASLDVVDRGRPRTHRAFVAGVVRATLHFAGAEGKAVSLLLTDDAGIAALHAEHLDDPSPTDVMSFDLDDGAEIVVNVAMAARVARAHGHAVRAEVALYIVHGLLHTLGFDDTTKRARTRMRAAERAVLQRLALHVASVDA